MNCASCARAVCNIGFWEYALSSPPHRVTELWPRTTGNMQRCCCIGTGGAVAPKRFNGAQEAAGQGDTLQLPATADEQAVGAAGWWRGAATEPRRGTHGIKTQLPQKQSYYSKRRTRPPKGTRVWDTGGDSEAVRGGSQQRSNGVTGNKTQINNDSTAARGGWVAHVGCANAMAARISISCRQRSRQSI